MQTPRFMAGKAFTDFIAADDAKNKKVFESAGLDREVNGRSVPSALSRDSATKPLPAPLGRGSG